MFRELVKEAAQSVAPKTAMAVLSARARNHSHRMVREWGLFEINGRLIREIGSSVIAGPFKGLTLTPMSREEHIGPYLVGTYEMELHPWWNELLSTEFAQVIDVGANFGFYAVGLARRLPHAQIEAFDTDWWARKATAEMAAENVTPNVTVHASCDPAWLQCHLRDGALLVSDCEGYEKELLCTVAIAALDRATMIVEVHESLSPGVSSAILARFSRTHVIEETVSRTLTPVPVLPPHSLTEDEVRRASTEVRESQTWLFLRPKRA